MLRLVVLFVFVQVCSSGTPVGVGSGAILDRHITSSDAYASAYKAFYARLNQTGMGGGGWVGDLTKATAGESWLQIDLGLTVDVDAVETQGISGNLYTTTYQLSYSLDGTSFTFISDGSVPKEFTGNDDSDTIVRNEISPPVSARYVRFKPTLWNTFPALRVELYAIPKDGACPSEGDWPMTPAGVTTIQHRSMCGGALVWGAMSRLCAGDGSGWDAPVETSCGSSRSVGISTTTNRAEMPVGFGAVALPNSHFSASGTYSASHQPSDARLSVHTTRSWLGSATETDQFLQIKFSTEIDVDKVSIQGNPEQQYFTTFFKLAFSTDGKDWAIYQRNGADHIFIGSSNNKDVVTHVIHPPVKAFYIRFLPVSFNNFPALRVDVFGAAIDGGCAAHSGWPWVPRGQLSVAKPYYIYGDVVYGLRSRLCKNDGTGWQSEIRVVDCDEADVSCVLSSLKSLGVSSGVVKDSQMSTKTLYSPQYSPYAGRLHTLIDKGAFIADESPTSRYLQIDFLLPLRVEAVATQGAATRNYYTTLYQLSTSLNGNEWAVYEENGNPKNFTGNGESGSVYHILVNPVTARYIRFIPITWESFPALRVDVFGSPLENDCAAIGVWQTTAHNRVNSEPTSFCTSMDAPLYGSMTRRCRSGTWDDVQKLISCGNLRPLGVASTLSDSQFLASSEYSPSYVASNARLNTALGSGAWVGDTNQATRWLEVDLGSEKTVSAIATQGANRKNFWTTSFNISYSTNAKDYEFIMENGAKKLFKGNTDSSTIVINAFPPITARYVRVYTVTSNTLPAIRMELYSDLGLPERAAVVKRANIPTGSHALFSGTNLPAASYKLQGSFGIDFDVGSGALMLSRLGVHWTKVQVPSASSGSSLDVFVYDRKSATRVAGPLSFSQSDFETLPLMGGLIYKQLTAPVGLPAGFLGSLVIASAGTGAVVGLKRLKDFSTSVDTDTASSSITLVGSGRWSPSSSPSLPIFADTLSAAPYLAPSMIYRACEGSIEKAAGLESGAIADGALSSSSAGVGGAAPNGRLGSSSGWSPSVSDGEQWLQVDLGALVLLGAVSLQGHGSRSEWVTGFYVDYSVTGTVWFTVQSNGTDALFTGNTDATTVVKRSVGAVGQYFRIRPAQWETRIALRTELHICDAPPETPSPTLPPLLAVRHINTTVYPPLPSNAATTGGAWLTFLGSDFGEMDASPSAYVGSQACSTTSWVSTSAVLCLSPPLRRVDTTLGSFEYDTPTLTMVQPTNTPATASISLTLHGTGFAAVDLSPSVVFHNYACQTTSWLSPTALLCKPPLIRPEYTPTLSLSLTQPKMEATNSRLFSFDAPLVTYASVPNSPFNGGISLTLFGSNFGTRQSSVMASVGKPCMTTLWISRTALACLVPPASTTGVPRVDVTLGDRSGALRNVFAYDSPDTVTMNVETNEDENVAVPIVSTSGWAINRILDQPSLGNLTQLNSSHVLYTPLPDLNGADTFTVAVAAGVFVSDVIVSVRVTVRAVNDPPTARDDVFETYNDWVAVENVLANDFDVDGDTLTLVSVLSPESTNGKIAVSRVSDTDIRIRPDPTFSGSAMFQYTVSDGLASSTGTVIVNVLPKPALPRSCSPPCQPSRGRCDDGTCTCLPGFINVGSSTDCSTSLIEHSGPTANTTEAGGTALIGLILRERPTFSVTCEVSSNDTTEGTVFPPKITFEPRSYRITQRVNVTGQKDPEGMEDDVDTVFSVIIGPCTSGDPRYHSSFPLNVSVINKNVQYPTITGIQPPLASLKSDMVEMVGSSFAMGMKVFVGGVLVSDYPTKQCVNGILVHPWNKPDQSCPAPTTTTTRRQSATVNVPSGPYSFSFISETKVRFRMPVLSAGYHSVEVVHPNQARFIFPDVYFTDACRTVGRYGVNGRCQDCPEGADCPGGDRLRPLEGYWNEGELSGYVYACVPRERCLGGHPPMCAEKYEGDFCALCKPNYRLQGVECVPCDDAQASAGWGMFIFFIVLCNLSLILMPVLLLEGCLRMLLILQGFGIVGLMQRTGSPQAMISFYGGLHALLFDLQATYPGCLGSSQLYLSRVWSNIGVLFLVGLPAALVLFVMSCAFRLLPFLYVHAETRGAWVKDRLISVFPIWLTATYYMWTLLVYRNLFCMNVGSSSRLGTTIAEKCWENEHTGVFVFSIFVLFILLWGAPVGILVYLRRANTTGALHDARAYRRRMGSVFIDFLAKYYYYHIYFYLVMHLMAMCVVFLQFNVFIQNIAAVIVQLVFGLVVARKKPMVLRFDNWTMLLQATFTLCACIGNITASSGELTATLALMPTSLFVACLVLLCFLVPNAMAIRDIFLDSRDPNRQRLKAQAREARGEEAVLTPTQTEILIRKQRIQRMCARNAGPKLDAQAEMAAAEAAHPLWPNEDDEDEIERLRKAEARANQYREEEEEEEQVRVPIIRQRATVDDEPGGSSSDEDARQIPVFQHTRLEEAVIPEEEEDDDFMNSPEMVDLRKRAERADSGNPLVHGGVEVPIAPLRPLRPVNAAPQYTPTAAALPPISSNNNNNNNNNNNYDDDDDDDVDSITAEEEQRSAISPIPPAPEVPQFLDTSLSMDRPILPPLGGTRSPLPPLGSSSSASAAPELEDAFPSTGVDETSGAPSPKRQKRQQLLNAWAALCSGNGEEVVDVLDAQELHYIAKTLRNPELPQTAAASGITLPTLSALQALNDRSPFVITQPMVDALQPYVQPWREPADEVPDWVLARKSNITPPPSSLPPIGGRAALPSILPAISPIAEAHEEFDPSATDFNGDRPQTATAVVLEAAALNQPRSAVHVWAALCEEDNEEVVESISTKEAKKIGRTLKNPKLLGSVKGASELPSSRMLQALSTKFPSLIPEDVCQALEPHVLESRPKTTYGSQLGLGDNKAFDGFPSASGGGNEFDSFGDGPQSTFDYGADDADYEDHQPVKGKKPKRRQNLVDAWAALAKSGDGSGVVELMTREEAHYIGRTVANSRKLQMLRDSQVPVPSPDALRALAAVYPDEVSDDAIRRLEYES